jgi:hypothetical protein
VNEGKRESLAGDLEKSVRFHFQGYRSSNLNAFRVERQKSSYAGARSELVIFDAEGRAVIKGREFGKGQFSLWSS